MDTPKLGQVVILKSKIQGKTCNATIIGLPGEKTKIPSKSYTIPEGYVDVQYIEPGCKFGGKAIKIEDIKLLPTQPSTPHSNLWQAGKRREVFQARLRQYNQQRARRRAAEAEAAEAAEMTELEEQMYSTPFSEIVSDRRSTEKRAKEVFERDINHFILRLSVNPRDVEFENLDRHDATDVLTSDEAQTFYESEWGQNLFNELWGAKKRELISERHAQDEPDDYLGDPDIREFAKEVFERDINHFILRLSVNPRDVEFENLDRHDATDVLTSDEAQTFYESEWGQNLFNELWGAKKRELISERHAQDEPDEPAIGGGRRKSKKRKTRKRKSKKRKRSSRKSKRRR